jgi:osmotically-inducible protein OsmY
VSFENPVDANHQRPQHGRQRYDVPQGPSACGSPERVNCLPTLIHLSLSALLVVGLLALPIGVSAADQETFPAAPTDGAAGSSSQAAPEGLSAVDEDARLQALIERRLAWDRELAPFKIEVQVNDAVANLSGTVSTTPESHLARRIADDVRGINAVVNGIYVDPALEPFAGKALDAPDDAELKERVITSLSGDPDVDAGAIDIDVSDGVVTLKGQVRNIFQKQRAERVTRSLFGVEGVVNEIEAEML